MLLTIWTNPRIASLEVAKTMKSNQLLCGRGIPCKDEGFERENSLTPVFLTIFIFYKLCIHKKKLWHGDARNALGYVLCAYDITY